MATRHYEVILFNDHGLRLDGYPVTFPKCREGLAKAIAEAESLVKQGEVPELISVNYRDEFGNGHEGFEVEWGWEGESSVADMDESFDSPPYPTPRSYDVSGASEDLDESMDGDFDSGMASAGFGTDEDYGYLGEDETYGADF